MSLTEDPALSPLLQRLGAYARLSVDRGAAFALFVHAELLTPEHVLVAVLRDEDCGATRLVLHAFGDPETIAAEVMALCPGIMVVGSERSVPFSVRGVEVLEGARRTASERGDPLVDVTHLFAAAVDRLSDEVEGELDSGEWSRRALETLPRDPGDPGARSVPGEGPLFAFFDQEARRALGSACRQATRLGREEISPAHLLLGCLETDDALAEISGTAARLRTSLRGKDDDPTPRARRTVSVEPMFLRMLEALPARAGTVELLGWILEHGTEEVRALMHRQRITPTLLDHARGSFEDPEPPAPPA